MVDRTGLNEREEDVYGNGVKICEYLALEPDGCDDQHEREFRRVTGSDGHCAFMGNHTEEDRPCGGFARSQCPL